jgi:hypothetical protein
MLEDILEPQEKIFNYKDKEYSIKPMNLLKTDKVLKLLPTFDLLKNPRDSILKLIGSDLDKIINIAIEASGIQKDVIHNMQPHNLVDLLQVIIDVNKPSFFLAWKKIEAVMSTPSTGKEQSKP